MILIRRTARECRGVRLAVRLCLARYDARASNLAERSAVECNLGHPLTEE